MQVVCEATQSLDVNVQISAFENLVRIMQLYYEKMKFYMEKALFGVTNFVVFLVANTVLMSSLYHQLTIMGMKHENEKVALQAVEFWSTVCDVELDLAADEEYEEAGDSTSQHFALAAVSELVPVLLFLLTKREEEEDEDEWNLSMAAATCLSLLANCVRDPIVAPVTPFVSAHIRSPDWRYREAAVMAFGGYWNV